METQIIYLENDHLWAELVTPELAKHGHVTTINNEHEFRRTIDELANTHSQFPSVIVLEQRVRWTTPAEHMPPPPTDVGTYEQAGIRCYEYLRKKETGRRTPVIFYTLVEPEQITALLQSKGIPDPADYQYVEKDDSFRQLHQAIRRSL